MYMNWENKWRLIDRETMCVRIFVVDTNACHFWKKFSSILNHVWCCFCVYIHELINFFVVIVSANIYLSKFHFGGSYWKFFCVLNKTNLLAEKRRICRCRNKKLLEKKVSSLLSFYFYLHTIEFMRQRYIHSKDKIHFFNENWKKWSLLLTNLLICYYSLFAILVIHTLPIWKYLWFVETFII